MTKKDIYKITNLINGKCYIGQASNPKRRFAEHKRMGSGPEKGKVLYYAFEKYGLENFTFEVIERQVSNYNEREKYWIVYYDSYENGYNMTEGGEEPPILKGENNPNTTHTKNQVDIVIDLLLHSDKDSKEIAGLTGYNKSTILRINTGELWNDKNLSYPLRPEMTKEWKKEKANLIKEALIYTDKTQKEIAKEFECSRSTITMINIGKNHFDEKLDYPLRKQTKTFSKEVLERVEAIKRDLKTTNLSYSEIGEKNNVDYTMVYRINWGKNWKDDSEQYPLRNID